MSRIERAINVKVPVSTAYRQWTQFEDFPRFMEGVREVRRVDGRRLVWRVQLDGGEQTWEAEITEHVPDARIAWSSRGGVRNAGVVTFQRLDPERTRIMVQMECDCDGAGANFGSAFRVATIRVRGDLERFKQLVERRGATDAARSSMVASSGDVRPGSA